MKWQDASELRKNKSHKRIRQDTCAKCMSDLEIEYDDKGIAIRVSCKNCGDKLKRGVR